VASEGPELAHTPGRGRAVGDDTIDEDRNGFPDACELLLATNIGGATEWGLGSHPTVSLVLRYEDEDRFWEFLRHCRNAAAHGNRFNLLHDEPRRPARWHHLEITKVLQGQRLFRQEPDEGELLLPADPVHLLWDLERANPHMSLDGKQRNETTL